MAYRIEVKPSVAKALGKLPRDVQTRLAAKIDSLAQDPRPKGAKKLSGEAETYRVRSGDYRVIYQIREEALLVLVVRIGHRREVYRK